MKRYPFSIFTVCVIWILSLAPVGSIELGVEVPLTDKWVHFIMYGCLTGMVWWEYWKQNSELRVAWLAVCGCLCPVAMGGVLELLQAYATSYRSGDWLDFLANSIGVALGVVVGLLAIRPLWLHRHRQAKA